MPTLSGISITSPGHLFSETWDLKPPIPPSSSPSMKLLCLGLGRTGTVSLRIALSQLGYNPYHGFSMMENPPDALLWREALDLKYEQKEHGSGREWGREEFERVFAGCDACLDIPGSLFVEELIRIYPQAKVVCTVRDVEGWYNSWRATIVPETPPTLRDRFLSKFMLLTDRASALYIPLMEDCVKCKYRGAFSEPDNGQRAKTIYKAHVELVKKLAPDCLMFDVIEGWEPLCKFLGKEVPRDERGEVRAFPRLNDRRQWRELFGSLMEGVFWRKMWEWSLVGLGVLVVGGSVWGECLGIVE